jgi:hypothetical protein
MFLLSELNRLVHLLVQVLQCILQNNSDLFTSPDAAAFTATVPARQKTMPSPIEEFITIDYAKLTSVSNANFNRLTNAH